ncbi:hypothetical protein EYR38_003293 [Pleurotus pulmonarius]|nr:hypothetical protein EYR38_003293 [Pleurotus pulmonarius]
MSDSKRQIFITRIRIRAKSESPVQSHSACAAVCLKVRGVTCVCTENWTWGDLDWELRPPIALNADDEALVMISPSSCDTTPTAHGEILATAKFADILALPRQNARRVHLQREHELGSVKIYFIIYEVCHVVVPITVSGADLLSHTLKEKERPVQRQMEASTWFKKLRVWADTHDTYDLITPFVLDDEFLPLGEDQTQDDDTQHEVAAVPADSGRIQYAMVGTKRPKPR